MLKDIMAIFTAYTMCSIKAWFQFRLDAVLKSLSVFIREISNAVVVYLTLFMFNSIAGWNIHEMFFLFSLLFLSYGIMIIFSTGLREFESVIKSGDLDRFLLRPRGVLFQIVCTNVDWFAVLGQCTAGLVMFILAINNIEIEWSFAKVLYLTIVLIGGTIIQFSVFLFIACLNIYYMQVENIREIFYWNLRRFACYPLNIFSSWVRFLLVFIVPFAFVNYFPTQLLLNKNIETQYPLFVYYATPIVASVMFVFSYIFWKISLKHYSSTGS